MASRITELPPLKLGYDAMKSTPPGRSKNRLHGILVPCDWDVDGNIIEIALYTHDEKAFVIEHSRVGNELLRHVRQRVIVYGKIRQRLDGAMLLRAANYEVLTDPENQIEITA